MNSLKPWVDGVSFKRALESARKRFPNNGSFSLLADEVIDDVVRRKKVPNARGIYLYFRCDDDKNPLYIGRAGTLNRDGTWKDQGLAERLTKKQEGVRRRIYFRRLMQEESIAGLTFHWFVTHDTTIKIIPALAEAELLQAYVDQYGCLPMKNHCF